MSNLIKAYTIGKKLFLSKLAFELGSEKNLTEALSLLSEIQEAKEEVPGSINPTDGEERFSKATWGDKINLEPQAAKGIEV